MTSLFNWLLSRPSIDQVPGLKSWIDDPRGGAVEIGTAFGWKLALFLAVIGSAMPSSFESNTPFDHSAIGALGGIAVWLLLRVRLARGVRLSPAGLEVFSGKKRVQLAWSTFDNKRRAVVWSGLLLTLPLEKQPDRVVTAGAIIQNRELILPLLQKVRPDDLYAAVNAGVAAFAR